jgi:hypothetical protein
MDRATAERVARFVRLGGTLFATMTTSFFDENGNRHPRPLLADVFGIESIEETLHYNDGCGYLSIEDAALRNAAGLAATTGGFSTAFRCTYSERSEPIASLFVPMAGSYDEFPTEKYVAVTRTPAGKGQCYYFAGDIRATLTNHGLVELKRLLTHLLATSCDAELKVSGAFQTLAVALREQKASRRLLVHFMNYTGQMKRPIDETIPCRDIEVTLRTSSPVKSVRLLRADQPVGFTRTAGGVRFTVPRVDLYEVAVVQSE